jgi:hypothetical protein
MAMQLRIGGAKGTLLMKEFSPRCRVEIIPGGRKKSKNHT